MAVKIKLKRLGKIRAPYYRIVVADSRTKRDGRAIEEIGKYHPKAEPSFIEVNSERAQHWLSVGAQPTDPVRKILEITGDWQKFKGLPGAEGTLRVAEPKADRKVAFAAALAETLDGRAARRQEQEPRQGQRPGLPRARRGAKADDAKAEKPTQPRPSKADAPKAEKADAPKAEKATAKAEQAKAEPAKADKAEKADPAKADAAKADSAKAEARPRLRPARATRPRPPADAEADGGGWRLGVQRGLTCSKRPWSTWSRA